MIHICNEFHHFRKARTIGNVGAIKSRRTSKPSVIKSVTEEEVQSTTTVNVPLENKNCSRSADGSAAESTDDSQPKDSSVFSFEFL